ncbi:hypothetical protein D041_3929B, partial [Vibrio parahaemolyticus EKP-008]
PTDDSFAASKI